MPKYVIERELPVAGQLSPQQLQAVSQTSCSVLRKLGPGDSVGSQLRDPGQNLLPLDRSQRGPDPGACQPGRLPRESNLGDHVDDRSNDSRTVITWPGRLVRGRSTYKPNPPSTAMICPVIK
jgi:hypothetical protein